MLTILFLTHLQLTLSVQSVIKCCGWVSDQATPCHLHMVRGIHTVMLYFLFVYMLAAWCQILTVFCWPLEQHIWKLPEKWPVLACWKSSPSFLSREMSLGDVDTLEPKLLEAGEANPLDRCVRTPEGCSSWCLWHEGWLRSGRWTPAAAVGGRRCWRAQVPPGCLERQRNQLSTVVAGHCNAEAVARARWAECVTHSKLQALPNTGAILVIFWYCIWTLCRSSGML
jgi:hypothetical protein